MPRGQELCERQILPEIEKICGIFKCTIMCKDKPECSLTAKLRVRDCAEMLGLSKRTVQRYITEGQLKAHIVGNSYRVFGRDLIIFWNEH